MIHDTNQIDVAVALPVYNLFSYGVPDFLMPAVAVGKRVLVPFGSRQVTGYVVSNRTDSDRGEVKDILDVLDDVPLIPAAMIPFLVWMADYYKHPLGQVIQTALPGGLTAYDLTFYASTDKGRELCLSGRLSSAEAEIVKCLLEVPCNVKTIRRRVKHDVHLAKLNALASKGWISSQKKLYHGRTRSKTARYVQLQSPPEGAARLTPKRAEVMAAIQSAGDDVSLKYLKQKMPNAAHLLRALTKSGHVRLYEKPVYRDPFGVPIAADLARKLSEEQKSVFTIISDALGKGFETYLLAGVTGSGKTEIYLQLAARTVALGFSVLVLVPEIALISQMDRRFRARFGEQIAVLHSGLTDGERYDQWQRILENKASIVIGARSAIFAPLEKPGLIIVDEEHDTSYKQESGFRYNARDLAVVRARQQGCIALLGSATPAVQSYHNVESGKYKFVRLSKRVEGQSLPGIQVVDLGENRGLRGIRRFITPELHQAMQETLARDEQVLLFLNRRGYAGNPVCRDCGKSLQCKNCEISMTLHHEANAYKCHYCGYTRPSTARCTACGSSGILRLGIGTEKIESAVQALFPAVRIARLDRDTTTRKGSLLKMLNQIRRHDVDVVIGTQMVSKGHDYPNITLVGIICADLSLSLPDFRAGERTFQLLAQVAGRAGRGKVPGRVILQTYNPGHFSIQAARQQDFEAFYRREIAYRKDLDYPPFTRIIQILVAGRDGKTVRTTAEKLGQSCREILGRLRSDQAAVEVMGPIPLPISRIAGNFRRQILLKGAGAASLHRLVNRLMRENQATLNQRRVNVAIDVDPFLTL